MGKSKAQLEKEKELKKANERALSDNAAKDGEGEEKAEEAEESSFETNQPVEFVVKGKKFEGSKFSFPAEQVEDRKRVLKEAYGKDIIKE